MVIMNNPAKLESLYEKYIAPKFRSELKDRISSEDYNADIITKHRERGNNIVDKITQGDYPVEQTTITQYVAGKKLKIRVKGKGRDWKRSGLNNLARGKYQAWIGFFDKETTKALRQEIRNEITYTDESGIDRGLNVSETVPIDDMVRILKREIYSSKGLEKYGDFE